MKNLAILLVLFSSVNVNAADVALSLDQALQEAINARRTSTKRFRKNYILTDKNLKVVAEKSKSDKTLLDDGGEAGQRVISNVPDDAEIDLGEDEDDLEGITLASQKPGMVFTE